MRLCAVQMVVTPPEFIDASLDMFKPSFERILHADTEVALKPIQGGLIGDNPLDMDNPYFTHLNNGRIIEALLEAEREGFDAAWVNCFGDPGVREARAVVGIPIIGACESSLHFACQLGRKVAIVANNMPGQIAQIEEQVRSLGLMDRLIVNGVRTEKEPFPSAWKKGLKNPQVAADSIAEVARGCVADGADVIVVGCCGSGPLCSKAGFNKLTIDGQDVPVLDPVMVAAKTTEMAVDIRKGSGLPIPSRVRNYVLPSGDDWTRVRSIFGLPI